MLSGKVGASASGLKIQACTASLNFEILFSRSSADDESITSQPVNSVSAPRLAPVVMNRRRDGSGIAFTASRTSSFLSTPGIRSLRRRPMTNLLQHDPEKCEAVFRKDHAQT